MMALAVGADRDRDETAETARRRLLDLAIGQQAKDGSWNLNPGGRPPIHGSPSAQTAWVILAMTDRATDRALDKRALEWRAKDEPADELAALALRVLVDRRLGTRDDPAKERMRALLRRQNDDGGWSQTSEMKSDAFRIGLVLYVLSGAKEADAAALDRARGFLVKNQQPDGSWPMTSRPAPPPGPGPARNLSIIRYWGSAWALIGLVRNDGPLRLTWAASPWRCCSTSPIAAMPRRTSARPSGRRSSTDRARPARSGRSAGSTSVTRPSDSACRRCSSIDVCRWATATSTVVLAVTIRSARVVLLKRPEIRLTEIDTIVVRDDFPLKTCPGYYVGGVPLRNQDGERVRIRIYRVDGVIDRR